MIQNITLLGTVPILQNTLDPSLNYILHWDNKSWHNFCNIDSSFSIICTSESLAHANSSFKAILLSYLNVYCIGITIIFHYVHFNLSIILRG